AELVQTLSHPNGWHRDTAARLIFERQDKAAITLLEKTLIANPQGKDRESALGRLHALYALDGLGALKLDHIIAAMSDPNEHLRRHAVRLSEKFLEDQSARNTLIKTFDRLADDPSIEVRYQLLFTLGLTRDGDRPRRIARILSHDGVDSWMEAA